MEKKPSACDLCGSALTDDRHTVTLFGTITATLCDDCSERMERFFYFLDHIDQFV